MVLEKRGMKLEQYLAFNFRYIAQHVRRRIPPPHILRQRVKAVFEFFDHKVCTNTGKPLFNKLAKKMQGQVLSMIEVGYLSDPPGMNMYARKTDKFGNEMVDEDGLPLYRSLR
jgi:hypothetical protein